MIPFAAKLCSLALFVLLSAESLQCFGMQEAEPPGVNVTTITANFSQQYTGHVAQGQDILYVYSYKEEANKSTAVRLTVTSNEADKNYPLLFVVRQQRSILSWQVPLLLEYKYDYYKVSRTLCPDEFQNITESTLIYVDVSSMTLTGSDFTLFAYHLASFQLEDYETKKLIVTPSEPCYFKFTFPEGVDSILVLARSESKQCAILSVQDTQCPVFEMDNNVKYRGMYQTMTTRAAITVTRDEFKSGSFFIVVVLKANSADCTEIQSILPREKNITLTTKHRIPVTQYVTAIVLAVIVFSAFYLAAVIIACFYHICHKNWGIPDLSDAERESETRVTLRSTQGYGSIEDPINRRQELGELSTDRVENRTVDNDTDSTDSSLDTTDIDLLQDADQEKEVFRTKTFLFVSDLAKKSRKNLSKRYKMYHWNLVTIAIFYGLPVVQLVITYQQVLHRTGDEDICYYNFECANPLGVISAFNNVFSNVGYVFLGILFIILVWRRDLIHKKAVERQDKLERYYGIPQHFGLFYAMGWALCMEGVMSACYHVCPNYSNFQFDTSFMYIIACLDMLKIYQIRHPDINAKAHVAYLGMAVIIFIAVIGVVYGTRYFWIVFAVFHLGATFLLSVQVYFMGRWKLNLGIFKRTFLMMRTDCCSRPMYPGRLALIVAVNMVNWGLAFYGVITRPQDFASYLLTILIVNLALYVGFYIVMKLLSKEKILFLPMMFIIICGLLIGFSLYFYLYNLTSWNLSPAESREHNRPCILMNFYDAHDVWHFLSSMALFFSFMILLTLDDDLMFTRRDRIPVF